MAVFFYYPNRSATIKHRCVTHLYVLIFYSAFTEAKIEVNDVDQATNIGKRFFLIQFCLQGKGESSFESFGLCPGVPGGTEQVVRLANVLKPVKWLFLIATFLLRFVSTSFHTLCNSASFYRAHSKILLSDLEILNAPFHV